MHFPMITISPEILRLIHDFQLRGYLRITSGYLILDNTTDDSKAFTNKSGLTSNKVSMHA